jgi:hypothetical protein
MGGERCAGSCSTAPLRKKSKKIRDFSLSENDKLFFTTWSEPRTLRLTFENGALEARK